VIIPGAGQEPETAKPTVIPVKTEKPAKA
jgi:hypothetical protein